MTLLFLKLSTQILTVRLIMMFLKKLEDLTVEDLDILKAQNQERIREIEQKYFQKKEEFKKVKEIYLER